MTQQNRARVAQIVFNASLLVVFAYLFSRTASLPSSAWEPLGAGSFPRLVLALLMALCGMIIVKEAWGLRRAEAGRPGESIGSWVLRRRFAFYVLGALGLYIALMPWLGFRWASLLFLLATQWFLGTTSWRARLVMVVIAVVFSFGLEALFRDVFNVILPRGRLF